MTQTPFNESIGSEEDAAHRRGILAAKAFPNAAQKLSRIEDQSRIENRVALEGGVPPRDTKATLVSGVMDKGGAAAYLLVSVRTVERLMASGQLSYCRVGAQIRFQKNQLDDLLAGRERKSISKLKLAESKKARA